MTVHPSIHSRVGVTVGEPGQGRGCLLTACLPSSHQMWMSASAEVAFATWAAVSTRRGVSSVCAMQASSSALMAGAVWVS
jgi:hypothetical protein